MLSRIHKMVLNVNSPIKSSIYSLLLLQYTQSGRRRQVEARREARPLGGDPRMEWIKSCWGACAPAIKRREGGWLPLKKQTTVRRAARPLGGDPRMEFSRSGPPGGVPAPVGGGTIFFGDRRFRCALEGDIVIS